MHARSGKGSVGRNLNSQLSTKHGSFFNKHYNVESQKLINESANAIKKYKELRDHEVSDHAKTRAIILFI